MFRPISIRRLYKVLPPFQEREGHVHRRLIQYGALNNNLTYITSQITDTESLLLRPLVEM